MQELKVIGVENGALLAASDDGVRFRIPIDDVLQSRIRQAQPEQRTGPKLSPREIQAHIRSGLSAEDVAQLTGVAVEYIRRFEGPVIAEREHVVTSALAVPVHGAADEPGDEPSTFGAVIRERLASLGAVGERWAAWKDEDRGWLVKLEFTADEVDHDARWTFDPRSQVLQPGNAEAIALSRSGELGGRLIPRLRAVAADADESRFDSGAFTFDEPLQSHNDTQPQLEPVPYGRGPAASSPAVARAAIKRADEPAAPTGETADLLEALRRRRGERESAAPVERVEAPRVEAEPAAVARPEPEVAWAPPPAAEPVAAPEETAASGARALWGGRAAGQGRQKRGRASMPSWDEIVFGARPDDDLA